MAKFKKKLVKKDEPVKKLDYVNLVNIVRRKKRNIISKDEAYNEIEYRIKPKIIYIVNQFYIPGCNFEDIYQEALYALRYKAIPDYNRSRGKHGPSLFDNFAVLCIRRHLSTLLKSSFQNKRRVLNTSISLNQDRGTSSDEMLFLSDILPKTNGNLLELLQNKEYYKQLFNTLFEKLSKFEKKVFLLYIQKYSYEEMTERINRSYKKKILRKRINIKSVDNALSRVKQKAKEIFVKYQEKELESEKD